MFKLTFFFVFSLFILLKTNEWYLTREQQRKKNKLQYTTNSVVRRYRKSATVCHFLQTFNCFFFIFLKYVHCACNHVYFSFCLINLLGVLLTKLYGLLITFNAFIHLYWNFIIYHWVMLFCIVLSSFKWMPIW